MLKRLLLSGLALILCFSLLVGCVPVAQPDDPTTEPTIEPTTSVPTENSEPSPTEPIQPEESWNSDIKIIPTPQSYICNDAAKPITGFSQIVDADFPEDETIAWGIQKLLEIAGNDGNEMLTLQLSEDTFFDEKNAAEQGYILTRDANGIVIKAQSSIGILYGLMTLRQLCEDAPETFEIYDRPQIRFRGNMNTLWAECGVWSYDFGDGIENAKQRIMDAIDQYALTKTNLMYADAFGFDTERFPGYNDLMLELAEYARIRGVRIMVGGYGMGYGMSAHKDWYMGTVFYNQESYPDGEIYSCIGTNDKARQHGTCLSNDALTDAKIEEIRNYLRATGVNTLYLHNMDDDQLTQDLWDNRCKHCRQEYPNYSLFAVDGAAGAFADFYDRIFDALLPEFPDLIICPVSPGYAYADSSSDESFEISCKFWTAVYEQIDHKGSCIPMFREQFYQHNEPVMRFDHLSETLPSYSVVYFSSGDGFYSDKVYTPSAAYTVFFKDADLVLCANGSAMQKPTMVTNAEYMWNPTNSAFWNLELLEDYEAQFEHYNDFREGRYRYQGIYGEGGLLNAACELLFGKENGEQIADIYRLRGLNREGPILYPCNSDLWTNYTKVNFPMLWDSPVSAAMQDLYDTRFEETAKVTGSAVKILAKVLQSEDLTDANRDYLQFMHDSAALCAELCNQLARYMDLYMEADRYFANGTPYSENLCDKAKQLQNDALAMLEQINNSGLEAFDPLGGILVRRDEMFEFVAYCAGQIIKSIETNTRIPEDRKPPNIRDWW